MYCFEESSEHKELRAKVKEFAESKIAPYVKELDQKEEFSCEITKQMGELGLLGMVVSKEYGGGGYSYLSYVIAVEELSRVDASQAGTVVAHNSLGIGPIEMFGTEKQKEDLLPTLCKGEKIWSFGLTEEQSGSDAKATLTRAEKISGKDSWRINGSKIWITNASTPMTGGTTVLAVSSDPAAPRKELTCFLVPTGTPGFTAKPITGKLTWRASNTSKLKLEGVEVPSNMVLGEVGKGFKVMMKALDKGRLSIAAMGLGLSKAAYTAALEYAGKRRTFGKPISQHQSIAFRLADMATRIEASESMLYKACWLHDNGKPFAKLAAMAKLYCSETAEFCAREAQQIFGGYGLVQEYDIERFYRDATLLRIGEGTSEIQRLVISRYIGC